MGGPRHAPADCRRAPATTPLLTSSGGVSVEPRGRSKRWRLRTAPADRAEVWRVTTAEPDGVPAVATVMVGPAFPGTTLPIQGDPAAAIEVVAAIDVEVVGAGYAPKTAAAWGGIPTAVWQQCAKSPCAWARFATRVPPQPPGPARRWRVVPHARLQWGQCPPMTVGPTDPAAVQRTTRCAYCAAAYPTDEAYIKGCAPDALKHPRT